MLGPRIWCSVLGLLLSTSACSLWQGPARSISPSTVHVEADADVEDLAQTGVDLRTARWYLLRAQEARAQGHVDAAQADLDRAYRNLAELEASDSVDDTTRSAQLAADIEQAYLDLLPDLERFSPDSPLVLLLEGLSEERIEDLSDDASQLVRIHQLSRHCDIPIDANGQIGRAHV